MNNIDQLIEKFREFKEELNKSAAAGPNPKVLSVKKPISPKDVGDAGPASFKVDVKKPNKGVSSERHPMSETLKFENNQQWKLDKVDPEENVNIPHPQGKAKMSNGINKGEDEQCAHCGKELGDKTDVYREGKNAFCSDTHMSTYDPPKPPKV